MLFNMISILRFIFAVFIAYFYPFDLYIFSNKNYTFLEFFHDLIVVFQTLIAAFYNEL